MQSLAGYQGVPPAALLERNANFGVFYAVRPTTSDAAWQRRQDMMTHCGRVCSENYGARLRDSAQSGSSALMKVKDQSPTVVVVDVSRGMKSNNETRRRSSETRPAPPRRSMHYDGKPLRLVLWMAVNSVLFLSLPFSLCLRLMLRSLNV